MKTNKEIEFDPRTYMELALEEMKKSTIDKRPDGKVSPKVGAVIEYRFE